MNLESGEYNAKYGRANAEGTGKYKGLSKDEKNALVSEYGQTEMTVLPDGIAYLFSPTCHFLHMLSYYMYRVYYLF